MRGFISIFFAVDPQTGKAIIGPKIQSRGFAEDEKDFDAVIPQVLEALPDAAENSVRDTHAFAQVVRRTVGRWVNTQRRRPMIALVISEAYLGLAGPPAPAPAAGVVPPAAGGVPRRRESFPAAGVLRGWRESLLPPTANNPRRRFASAHRATRDGVRPAVGPS